jgi:hypothetical protein
LYLRDVDTVKRFLIRNNVHQVKTRVAWSPDLGHHTVLCRPGFYDPDDVIYVLRRRLINDIWVPDEERHYDRTLPPPERPPPPPGCHRRRAYESWSTVELERRILAARDFEQWIYPQEVAVWLIVHEMTLYRWRTAGLGPPFLQGPNLVPSSRRNPDNTIKPLSQRTLQPSFNHRFDRVLYDRNRVVAWLKKIYLQRIRNGV